MTELEQLRLRVTELERAVLGEPVREAPPPVEEPPRESFLAFVERQGCEYVTANNRHLFANGAQSNESYHFEPPTDPEALLELRYEYLRVKLAKLTKQYEGDRQAILEQARYHSMGAGPLPAPGWEEHLKNLSQEIETLHAEKVAVAARLRRNQASFAYDAYRVKQRAEANGVLAALQQLPVYQE